MIRILNVIPCNSDVFTPDMAAYAGKYLDEHTVVDSVRLREGTPSIEGALDELLNSPHAVELAIKGEQDGYDAVFINCFGDPGVAAARECVDIPVFGGFEPAVLIAMGLADKIGIITVVPNVVPVIKRHIAAEHLDGRVVSVRDIGIAVLELCNHERLCNAVLNESLKAVKEDGVQAIVLGCTGLVDVTETVRAGLKDLGYDIPVIEAAHSALNMLEMYAKMGLRHSRLTYLKPTSK